MGRIIVRDSKDVEPTIFKGRESRRLFSPERDNSNKMSLHKVHRWAGISSGETKYAKNDEILYILEGEGYVFEGEKSYPLRPGSCVFIPANTGYRIYNPSDLRLLAILSPPRYRDEWKERPDLVQLEPPYSSSASSEDTGE